MNTFALILLAFPFYLATKGRLTAYTALATTASTSAPENTTPAQTGATLVPSLLSGFGN